MTSPVSIDIPNPDSPIVLDSPNDTGFGRRGSLWGVSLLIVATIGLYWPTLGYDFVNWDDPWYVQNNDLIRSWHPSNLYHIATQHVTRNFAPLTVFSFLVDHTFWGLNPAGYHATNVLLHLANGLLVFGLISRLAGSRLVGFATALLFVVHPVQVETVAWVSSRKGLLSAAFMLGSLNYWLRPDRNARDEAIGIALLAGALLCKALAVVIPAIVLTYDLVVRRREFAESLVRQIVPGLLALFVTLITMSAQSSIGGGVREHFVLNKFEILAVDSILLWKYVGMLIAPGNLSVMYDPPTSGIAGQVVMSMVGWTMVAAALFTVRRRYPLVVLAAVSSLLLMLPVLNLIPLTTLMNDRYLYLPSIAVFAVAAGALERMLSRFLQGADGGERRPPRLAFATVCAAMILATSGAAFAYARITQNQLPVWSSSMALWEHAITHTPDLPVVRIQHACALRDQGRYTPAMKELERVRRHRRTDRLDKERVERMLAEWKAEAPRQVQPAKAFTSTIRIR